MGIKRCPYCRALISDQDQYCKNCGTQLLFPEDEEIEEEIPGDKIIEDDRDKESLTEEEVEEELKEGLEEEAEEEEEEEDEEKSEVILVDEDTAALDEAQIKKLTGGAGRKTRPEDLIFSEEEKLPFPRDKTRKISLKEESGAPKTEEYLIEKIKKEVLSGDEPKTEQPASSGPGIVTRMVEELARERVPEESAGEEEQPGQPGLVTRMVEELGFKEKREAAESYEVEPEEESTPAPATFESAELDKVGATAELGRREVEDFFRVLEEKEKERLKEKLKSGETGKIETGEVPSWIKEVKTASTELLKGTEETGEIKEPEKMEAETDELWLEEEERATEPTMGFPEKLTRSELELAEPAEETTEELEMELEEEIQKTDKSTTEEIFRETPVSPVGGTGLAAGSRRAAEGRALPPLGFKNFVKAKIFDLLFLVMFWLVSIWIAARSMQTTIFKLLGLASSGLLFYLLILTFFYFFLFYFFIGETLGDRLFQENE
ncbi:MAG: zinc ribbon domain-containing protein [Candidatus Saccharicenans sp.]|uniref:zinc ribbon domain-containing protein n=1 Tax=Candidatus Saccharicenans sp. TaxID=2819258 RepID=UPI00404B53FE